MDSNINLSGQDNGWTVYALIEMCRKRVLQVPEPVPEVTVAAVAFYVLEWVSRQGVRVTGDNPLVDEQGDELSQAQVAQRIEVVIENLERWGASMAALQAGDAKEWEMVRVQMEKSLQGFNCRWEDKEDALQEALFNLFRLLLRMPKTAEIGSGSPVDAKSIIALLEKHSQNLGALYNFGSSLYAYARAIARKSMLNQLRKLKLGTPEIPDLDDEEWEQIISDDLPPEASVEKQEWLASMRELLRIGLTRLLCLIPSELSKRRQEVILLSLAARPRFWQALELVEVAAPAGLVPLPSGTQDDQLAQMCGPDVNNLRSTRTQAKGTIYKYDTLAGQILDALLHKTKGEE